MSDLPRHFVVLQYTDAQNEVTQKKTHYRCSDQELHEQLISDPNIHGYQTFSVEPIQGNLELNFYVPFENEDHGVHAKETSQEIYFGLLKDIPSLEQESQDLSRKINNSAVFNSASEQKDEIDWIIQYAKSQDFQYVIMTDKGERVRFLNKNDHDVHVMDRKGKTLWPKNRAPSKKGLNL